MGGVPRSGVKVLVVGGGGREHALCWALAKSPRVAEVVCSPGNAGIAAVARCEPGGPDVASWVALAERERADLVVVGPEAPLVAGLVDALAEKGIPAFGPTAAAARLEGSKAFAKDFMRRQGIPTAAYAAFQDARDARAHAEASQYPLVVKDGSLAGGKGVTIARTAGEARAAIDGILASGEGEVVIEEFLVGEEVSIMAVCDGETALILPPSQDHKQLLDGDNGPMTGGMGVICPYELGASLLEEIRDRIVLPTLEGMRAEGTPFRGLLYPGLMLTADGPKVLEFNVRFGDPETEAVLPLLQSDLLDLLEAAAKGSLRGHEVHWRDGASATVILAAPGYPEAPRTGVELTVPDDLPEDALVFHAGTRLQEGRLFSSGGRVLAVTGVAGSLEDALEKAYGVVDQVTFPGAMFRRDIGRRPGSPLR
jgi:phosphoribosylamine--glycine ligase